LFVVILALGLYRKIDTVFTETDMREIKSPLPIFRLQVGEMRAQLIGGAPQGWARVAYMTEEGITLGDTTFSAWSPKAWELLKDLTKQVEEDLEQALLGTQYQQWSDSVDAGETKESGVENNPFGREVRDTWNSDLGSP
jgi:hypothetical protein